MDAFPHTGGDSSPEKMYGRKYLKQAAMIEDIEQKTAIEEKNGISSA